LFRCDISDSVSPGGKGIWENHVIQMSRRMHPDYSREKGRREKKGPETGKKRIWGHFPKYTKNKQKKRSRKSRQK
jgi:hypothetical protein